MYDLSILNNLLIKFLVIKLVFLTDLFKLYPNRFFSYIFF